MPFSTTRVLHPAWAEHHAPVATGTMNADCLITNGTTGGGWHPTDGPQDETPIVTYTGRCRVQYASTQDRDGNAADQSTSTQSVLVSLPMAAMGQEVGARVKITAVDTNGPQRLVGRVLTVQSVNNSSLSFEQDLTCSDDQTNQPKE